MSNTRRYILILAICGVLQCEGVVAQTSASNENAGISNETSNKNEYAFWKYLWPILRARHLPAFVSYLGTCSPDDRVQVPFPVVEVLPPSSRQKGLNAIRDIFRNAPEVEVQKRRGGSVTINIGKAPDALLDTRIRALNFYFMSQYDPTLALAEIDNNQDVRAGERRLQIDNSKWVEVMDGLSSGPEKWWAHLPPVMHGITLRTAMTRLAEKFRGAAIYGACPSGLRTDLDFKGISDYGGTHFISP